MTLPITYADAQTVHGTDVDTWTAVVNALTAFMSPPGATLVAGFTTTVTSGTTLTLTVTSTTMQVLTGSSTQLVKLATTSVVSGAAWIISNQSSATATVESSGANTITTIPAGGTAIFTAETATPTTAAGWAYSQSAYGINIALGKILTASNSLTLAGTDGTTMTFPGTSDTVVTLAATQTETNKRITPRVGTTTSSVTPTINTDSVDIYGLTAQAVAITSFTTNLSGTPTDGQKLWIYIVGTGAQTIAWGTSFEASTTLLPTTTVSTNRLDVGFVWNAATSKWRCVAVA